jgi:hypothetical protein
MTHVLLMAPGQAVVLQQQLDIQPVTFSVGDEEFGGFISGLEFESPDGVQYQYSLDDAIYIYTFGPRMGGLMLHGFSFPWTSEEDEEEPITNNGWEAPFSYFFGKRVSETGELITVTIGSGTDAANLSGFLDGFRFTAQDPVDLVASWIMKISTLPETLDD